jgi:energy-converting hydrogenase Eha subunit A
MNYIVYKVFTFFTAIATGAVVVIDMIMGVFNERTLMYLCVCVGLSVNVFNEYLDKVLGMKK